MNRNMLVGVPMRWEVHQKRLKLTHHLSKSLTVNCLHSIMLFFTNILKSRNKDETDLKKKADASWKKFVQ